MARYRRFPKIPSALLKRRLLTVRPGVSGQGLCLDQLAGELEFLRTDWVSTWLDPRNRYTAPATEITATRAITTEGRLIWLVRNPAYRRPYHARAVRPTDAVEEARTAWRRRQEMKRLKPEVRRIVRDLRWLRVRHEVTVADAYASPLCEEGVDGFLRALGLARWRRFPGWLIAWLFAVDRQVGFVLYEAHLRRLREARQTPGTVAITAPER